MSKEVTSKNERAHSVKRQINGRSGFSALLRETEAYVELNRRIEGAIPTSARGEIGVARIVDGCVVIGAASPARATQARLAADDILDAARNHWPTRIESARVVVIPGVRFGT